MRRLFTAVRSRIACLLGRLPLATLLGVQERGQQRVALTNAECERAPRVVVREQRDVVCAELPQLNERLYQRSDLQVWMPNQPGILY